MNNNQVNNLIEDQDDVDLIFLGSVKDETKGFDFEGTVEPRDFDKYNKDLQEIDSMP
ncbi:hypothetical protein R4670_11525 [Acinetobacter baumannii]|uniref:hypothetical protein n=1 Tax=Acinetobacter calcoaceticus TaxID=471 RepID=UPI0012BAF9AB|nr:hypothetical protein [Acinetobacter calcoaceticus]MDV7559275.1 hypothetical protein [Acinetobacter baumannii]MDV7619271.1 hypothetical protein [Acinetobacter baumannii]